jgi:hypothetical protein
VFGAESGRRANVIPDKGKEKEKQVDLKASARLGQSVGPGAKREVGVKAGKAWR